MFSINPIIGTFSVWYISAPRFVTSRAAFCGVLTKTTPSIGTCCDNVRWTSPVPGGVSTISKSNGDHSAPFNSRCNADITSGPRQMTGLFGSIKKPIDKLKWFCMRNRLEFGNTFSIYTISHHNSEAVSFGCGHSTTACHSSSSLMESTDRRCLHQEGQLSCPWNSKKKSYYSIFYFRRTATLSKHCYAETKLIF